jgi:hypothetical protein
MHEQESSLRLTSSLDEPGIQLVREQRLWQLSEPRFQTPRNDVDIIDGLIVEQIYLCPVLIELLLEPLHF